MEPRDDIHQQMLELIYGLLPDDQSAALAQRISSDGQLARQYAELKERTELLAEAAKRPVVPTEVSTQFPPLTDRMEAWKRAAEGRAAEGDSSVAADQGADQRGKASTSTDRPGRKSAAWNGALYVLAGLAACLLVGAFGYPWLHEKGSATLLALADERAALPGKFLAVSISGPAQLVPNQRNQFQAQLQTVAHEPLSGEVEFTFKNPAGNIVYAGRTTARDGLADWIIPPDELYDELTLEVVAAASGQESRFSLPLRTAQPVVRATLETDRPRASPGQRLHFRGITLTEPNQQPVETEVQFALIDPQGNRRSLTDTQRFARGGVAQGSVPLDADASPGTYQLVMSSPNERFEPTTQNVRVAPPRSAPYQVSWRFERENYWPGNQVEAELFLRANDRSPLGDESLANRPLASRPLVLDLPTPQDSRRELTTDDQGEAKFTFPLAEGEGPWWIALRDRETNWMTVTPVPSHPKATQVEFFPEGGVLVEGLSNQVYFYARDAAGQPAPMAGKIMDDQGELVAEGATMYEGRGSFSLAPQPERTYTFHSEIDEKTFPLPTAERISAAMHVPQGVTRSDQPLEVEVWPRREGTRLALIATQDGVAVGHEIWDAGRNIPIRQHIALRLPEQVTGMVDLGLYQLDPDAPEKSLPLGSRRVYRQPVQRLEIEVRPGKETYQRGEMAELLVETRDEFGYPVEAHLGLRVAPLEPNQPTQQAWGLDWARRLVEQLEDPAALEGIRAELESGTFDPLMLDLILATDRPRPSQLPGQSLPGQGLLEPSLLAALRAEEEGQATTPLSIPVTGGEWEALRSLAGRPAEPAASNRLAIRDRPRDESARSTPLGRAAQGPLPVLSWSNRAEVVAQYKLALAPLEERWQAEIVAARAISHGLTAVGGVLLGIALIGLWASRTGVGLGWRRKSVVGMGLAVSLASLAWGVYWLEPFSPNGPAEYILAYRDDDVADRERERAAPAESTTRAPADADRPPQAPARRLAPPPVASPDGLQDAARSGQRETQTEPTAPPAAAEMRGAAQPGRGMMSDAMEPEMAAEETAPMDQTRESQPPAMRTFGGEPARQRMTVPSEKATLPERLTEPGTEPVLWRPALRTNRQGEERVTFSLPSRPGLYRVEVSGFGQGRIGSQVITLRVE